jgi:hypothetical protein
LIPWKSAKIKDSFCNRFLSLFFFFSFNLRSPEATDRIQTWNCFFSF